jgi:hypothetical protein
VAFGLILCIPEVKQLQVQMSNISKRRKECMDLDTTILLALTACAYCWFVLTGIFEQKSEIKAREKEETERLQRAERLKKLCGRS